MYNEFIRQLVTIDSGATNGQEMGRGDMAGIDNGRHRWQCALRHADYDIDDDLGNESWLYQTWVSIISDIVGPDLDNW